MCQFSMYVCILFMNALTNVALVLLLRVDILFMSILCIPLSVSALCMYVVYW